MCRQNQLFEGLEDDESSFGNDTFIPRRSVKKLVINRVGDGGGSTNSTTGRKSPPASQQSDMDDVTGLLADRRDRAPQRYRAGTQDCLETESRQLGNI